jgi:hypothetical protein
MNGLKKKVTRTWVFGLPALIPATWPVSFVTFDINGDVGVYMGDLLWGCGGERCAGMVRVGIKTAVLEESSIIWCV